MCPAFKDTNVSTQAVKAKHEKTTWQSNFRVGSGFPSWALDWSATQPIALQIW